MLDCLMVGIGGFLGSVARYLMGLIPIDKSGSFPVNTLIINIIGAFAIGLIAAFVSKGSGLDERNILLLKTGICGGFTTFSTFALESVTLFQSGRPAAAVAYCALSLVLSIAAVFLAQSLAG